MIVLIADDSTVYRTGLVDAMTDLDGIDGVIEAGDVPAALEALQRARPDVLLLDVEMPGGDSLQVLEKAKNGGSDIPVIVLTAFPYPQYRRQFLAAGADYFFDKAADFERMIKILQDLASFRNLSVLGGEK